jgi:elongation factor Ts
MASAEQIQQLRKETGAGIMDVKKALDESEGDIEQARDLLRKQGAAIAAKKGERETHEGAIFSYIHAGGRIGVLLKLYCETDFVARTDDFQDLGKDLALHIAALAPQYVSRADVPASVVTKEKEIYAEQVAKDGKPREVVGKIVSGKLDKFYEEVVLLEQKFVKDAEKTTQQRIEAAVAKLGENIQVGEFVRLDL